MCSRRSRNYEAAADRTRSITTMRFRPGRSNRTGACSMFSSRKASLLMLALGVIIAAGIFARAAERGHSSHNEKPGYFGYGEVETPEQIVGWDIDARGDDGAGLPTV